MATDPDAGDRVHWSLLPRIHDDFAKAERNPRYFVLFWAPFILGLIVLFWLPPFRRFTGIHPLPATFVLAANLVQYIVYMTPVYDRAPVAMSTLILCVNASIAPLLVALTGRPTTLLWGLTILYPMFAANATRPSFLVLFVVGVEPLAVLAAWTLLGVAPAAESVAPACLGSMLGACLYAAMSFVFARNRNALASAGRAARDTAVDNERKRISNDLHTSLGAALTESMLWLEIAASQDGEAGRAAERARRSTAKALAELRECVASFGSTAVRREELERVLRTRLGQLCEAAGVTLAVDVRADRAIAATITYHVLKFIEEATLNSIRHAKASRLDIAVEVNGMVRADVNDDGRGFDLDAVARGAGLRALGDHADALGGVVEIDSRPGSGTRVSLRAR